MFKINYSINGVKRWIAPDPVWWTKHWAKIAGAAAVVLLVFVLAGCSTGSDAPAPAPVPVVAGCEGTYTASINPPSHEDRIIARNASLTMRGIAITGNDATDNAATGGGTPDGGIFLAGSAQWTTGPQVGNQCPIVAGTVTIFGYEFPASGGINAPSLNPDFGFGWGGSVVGTLKDGKITGKVIGGGGEEFVFGVLDGTFTPVTK